MVQDLYILMITAAVVRILFKLLKQPVVLGYIVAGVLVGPHLFGKTFVNEGMGRHWRTVCIVLYRSGVPSEEPHQQRQGGSNRCVDHHRWYDALWLPRGMGC